MTATAKPGDLHPPRALDPDEIEAGRLLFARECRFIAGAANIGALPPEGLPEVAFIGRSNVGKSSLVNALTGRRMLARTSNTPGRTRQLNFFDLDGRLVLVDLPGYGYAEASPVEKKQWIALIQKLPKRTCISGLFLIVDIRRGIKDQDVQLLDWADASGWLIHVLLTKADKLNQRDRAAVLKETQEHLGEGVTVQLFSATDKIGVQAAQKRLMELLAGASSL